MNHLPVILACLLASCGSRAIIVKPITPAVTSARAEVAAAGKATSRVHVGVADVAKQLRGVSIGINEALEQAGAMREASLAGSPESEAWHDQWDILTQIRARNMFAETAANNVVKESIGAQRAQKKAETALTDLETAATDHDEGVQEIQLDAAKKSNDAATWRSIKKAAWAIAIMVILACIVIAAIKAGAKEINPL